MANSTCLCRLGSPRVSSASRRNVRWSSAGLTYLIGGTGSGVARKLMNEVLATADGSASDRLWLGVWERDVQGSQVLSQIWLRGRG